ncbi:uncharacterized protein LOC113349336 [Papaver somniferum]|uniref:uncharacterized protein LOC113349336 n=1 Tax=Papaver somniferum TaxID=3469 RepID=UPI000E705E5C|nr:uncharacterized protein LOC113349336 [Papaver somniferum]
MQVKSLFAGCWKRRAGLSVIVSAVLTCGAIFQRMKNYTIYAVLITIHYCHHPYCGLGFSALRKPKGMTSKGLSQCFCAAFTSWSFVHPGLLPVVAFLVAQLVVISSALSVGIMG